ncbi:MAG: enhancer of mRNA decapping [Bogoriella megaspora]|nr:MAG: enhancer of mRNA decapping [Bogoriella megaspora]
MADNFIGLTVAVTLNAPQSLQVQGLVANVVGHTLYLQDVFFPATRTRLPSYNIDGSQIADIQIPQDIPGPSSRPSNPRNTSTPITLRSGAALVASDSYLAQAQSSALLPVEPASQSFVDPAILSYARKPTAAGLGISGGASAPLQIAHETPATPVKSSRPIAAAAAAHLPPNGKPYIGGPHNQYLQASTEGPKRKGIGATLTEPFNAQQAPAGAESDTQEETDDGAQKGGANRRDSAATARPHIENGAKGDKKDKKKKKAVKKKGKPSQATPSQNDSIEGTVIATGAGKKKGKANGASTAINPKTGWRSTPILEETPRVPGLIGGNVARDAAKASNKKNKKQKAMEREANRNGWATEDATDIQELGDFDFAGNLSRFDKRTVFNQIRNEDTTADEDRLVSHNRLPQDARARPGTYGGKNYHPTENVLDPRNQPSPLLRSSGLSSSSFQSIVDDNASRRAVSRLSTKRFPVRSTSIQDQNDDVASRVGRPAIARSKKHSLASHAAPSPKPPHERRTPSLTNSPQVNQYENEPADIDPTEGNLYITPGGIPCPTLPPSLLSALEAFAANQYLLTETLLAEASARGIADTALSALNPGGRRLARENLVTNPAPVVVVLAGKHIRGARAVAAARWLRERGISILIGVLGFHNSSTSSSHPIPTNEEDHPLPAAAVTQEEPDPDPDDEEFTAQLQIFTSLGGRVHPWPDLERRLKNLSTPPELIIDAIVSRSGWSEISDSSTSTSDPAQAEALRREAIAMVAWANRSRAECLAVETPTGLDAETGEIRIHEGEPLLLRPRFVVCLGAPLMGLLGALRNGEGTDWRLGVVDVGLDGVWKRASKRAAAGGLEELLDSYGLDPWTVGQLADFGRERVRVEFGGRWSVGLAFVHGRVEGVGEE